jgi:hypothetical protein
MNEFLVPHNADGNPVPTTLAGVNGMFRGLVTFLADIGSYTFLASVCTDRNHGQWIDTPGSGHAMSLGGGFSELGSRTWVPDWKGGHISLTDDSDRVLARCTEAMSHRDNYEGPIFGLNQPTQLWIVTSEDLLDTPYAVMLRHKPVQTTTVKNSGPTPWINTRPTAGH